MEFVLDLLRHRRKLGSTTVRFLHTRHLVSSFFLFPTAVSNGLVFENATVKRVFESLTHRKLREITFISSTTLTDDLLLVSPLSTKISRKSTQSLSGSSDSTSTPSSPAPGFLFGQLKHLDLSRCFKLTSLPQFMVNLRQLNISNCNFEDHQILQVLPSLKKLELLDVSCCRSMTGKFFEGLSTTAPPRLFSLLVSKIANRGKMVPNTRWTSPALNIADPLISIPTLTRLDLTGIHTVGKAALLKIAETSSNLERAHLAPRHWD